MLPLMGSGGNHSSKHVLLRPPPFSLSAYGEFCGVVLAHHFEQIFVRKYHKKGLLTSMVAVVGFPVDLFTCCSGEDSSFTTRHRRLVFQTV